MCSELAFADKIPCFLLVVQERGCGPGRDGWTRDGGCACLSIAGKAAFQGPSALSQGAPRLPVGLCFLRLASTALPRPWQTPNLEPRKQEEQQEAIKGWPTLV